MDREKEIDILGKIVENHKEYLELEQEIKKISTENLEIFPPATPSKFGVEQKIKNKEKMNIWIILLTIFFTAGIGTIIYWIIWKDKINKLTNEEFNEKMEEYNNVLLPNYLERQKEWENKKSIDLKQAEEKYETKKEILVDLFSKIKSLPLQYRYYDAEKYIYDVVLTSNYSITEAMALYDRNKGLQIEQQKLEEKKQANKLFAEQNDIMNKQNTLITQQTEVLVEGNRIAQEGNKIAEQQNKTLDRMRKNNNLANAIGVVQAHNTNKHLKDISSKL